MLLKVLKNTFFVFLSQVLLLLSSLGVYAVVGRKLGPDGLGQFSFVLAYVGLFTFLPDLGINLFLIREITRNQSDVRSYLGNASTLVLILAPLTFGVIAVVNRFMSLERQILQSIYLAGTYLVLGALIALFRAAFHAFEHMELETYAVTIERLMTFVACLGALGTNSGLLGLIGAHVVARVCALLTSGVIFILRIAPLPRLSLDPKLSLKLLKRSLPFALNTLTTTIYIQVDLVLLRLWIGDEASGYYKAATSLIIPLAVVATAMNSAMFPSMARAFVSSSERLKSLVEASIRYLFILGWPLALGVALLAPRILALVYGGSFQASVMAIQILAIIIPMRFINNSMGNGLTAIDRQGLRAGIILASAVINIVLNIFMIPKWSYIGASISTLITEFFILVSLYIGITAHLGRLSYWQLIQRALVSGAVTAIVTYALRDANLILAVTASVFIYCVALLVFKAMPDDDLSRIKQAVYRSLTRVECLES